MDKVIVSLYAGSLFTVVFMVSPVLLRTDKNKDLAGHFYGKILWRFYYIFLPLLFLNFLLNKNAMSIILISGLTVNVIISSYLKSFKRKIGRIENLEFNNPLRRKFRYLSYLSLSILFLNFLLSIFTLISEEVRWVR